MSRTASILHFEILDPWGKPHFVPELWATAPAVLGFVRHFGCIFCHEQVAELRRALPEVERHGARVSIIGNGNPAHALGFADRTGVEATRVFTDPARLLYRALGMTHGVGGLRGLRATAGHSLRAWQRGHRQLSTQGDPWQQGGTLVVARDGRITYSYLSRAAGDNAPIGRIIDAVRSLSDSR